MTTSSQIVREKVCEQHGHDIQFKADAGVCCTRCGMSLEDIRNGDSSEEKQAKQATA